MLPALLLAYTLGCAPVVQQAPPASAPTTPAAQAPQQVAATFPSHEMARFAQLVVGRYKVTETHHARPGRPEWAIEGTSTYRLGPNGSVVEDYQSNNPRGVFTAVAVLWWDAARSAIKHFECETWGGCSVVEDEGRWQGDVLVFAGEVERQGRKVRLEKHYDFSKPGTFVYRECAAVDGGPLTTLMTITHTRL